MSPLSNEKEQPEMLENNDKVVPPSSEMLKQQQVDFDSIDLVLKTIYMEIARKELEKKTLEVEAMKVNLEIKKLELEGKRHDIEKKCLELRKLQRSVIRDSLGTNSSESSGTPRDTPITEHDP